LTVPPLDPRFSLTIAFHRLADQTGPADESLGDCAEEILGENPAGDPNASLDDLFGASS